MSRPRNPNPPIHTKLTKRPQRNGWTYVCEEQYQYSHDKQTNVILSSKLVGMLAPGCDDLKQMVPTGKRGRPKKDAPNTIEQADIKDSRDKQKIKYPLESALCIMIMAILTGHTNCTTIASFWNTHREYFCGIFSNIPNCDISHDTIRRLIITIGRIENSFLLSYFTRKLKNIGENNEHLHRLSDEEQEFFGRKIFPLDGQAVRACKLHPGSKHSRYILNIFDVLNGLALEQCLVEEKTNETTHTTELLKKVDVNGGIVTADALNTTTAFVNTAIMRGADYVLPVKANRKTLCNTIKDLFNSNNFSKDIIEHTDNNKEHGRIERRHIRVLPGALLDADTLDSWVGLSDGSIAELSTEFVSLSTGEITKDTRYYITSLKFVAPYIAKHILYVIRGNWNIENRLYWVLDALFSQDKTQCKNAEFLRGKTTITKISFNFITKFVKLVKIQTGKSVSNPVMQTQLENLDTCLKLMAAVCEANWAEG